MKTGNPLIEISKKLLRELKWINDMYIVLGIFAFCFIVSVAILTHETKHAVEIDDKEPFLWDEKK